MAHLVQGADLTSAPVTKWSFWLSVPPLSMNSPYQIIYSQYRVQLSPAARVWKQRVKEQTPRIILPPNTKLRFGPLSFHAKWLTQQGNPRRFDVHNCVKLLVDAVCERLGVDDCWVWEAGPYHKVESVEQVGIQVSLGLLP